MSLKFTFGLLLASLGSAGAGVAAAAHRDYIVALAFIGLALVFGAGVQIEVGARQERSGSVESMEL